MKKCRACGGPIDRIRYSACSRCRERETQRRKEREQSQLPLSVKQAYDIEAQIEHNLRVIRARREFVLTDDMILGQRATYAQFVGADDTDLKGVGIAVLSGKSAEQGARRKRAKAAQMRAVASLSIEGDLAGA